MNFFKTLNELSVKYDMPSTRGCYKELVALFTDYLQNLEKQMKNQAKKQAQKSFVDQVKESGHVYNFGPNDTFVRKHFPNEVAQIEAAIKQHLTAA